MPDGLDARLVWSVLVGLAALVVAAAKLGMRWGKSREQQENTQNTSQRTEERLHNLELEGSKRVQEMVAANRQMIQDVKREQANLRELLYAQMENTLEERRSVRFDTGGGRDRRGDGT